MNLLGHVELIRVVLSREDVFHSLFLIDASICAFSSLQVVKHQANSNNVSATRCSMVCYGPLLTEHSLILTISSSLEFSGIHKTEDTQSAKRPSYSNTVIIHLTLSEHPRSYGLLPCKLVRCQVWSAHGLHGLQANMM